jgi:hypothetical protein
MLAVPRSVVVVAVAIAAVGCVPPQTSYDAQRDNPLGPSFWMVPTPSSDEGLLGRTFARPPDVALTLEEQSAPNPCAALLSPRRDAPMANHYENAVATSDSADGGALLATYGFAADARVATHLLYKVTTSRKVTQLDTTEYQACCQEQDCGWGYVQALISGEGEYAAGSEASAQAQANYTVVNGRAARSFRVAHKKAIKGYLAAVIVAHDRGRATQACATGWEWAATECVPRGKLAAEEQLCRNGTPRANDPFWADDESMLASFRREQAAACDWLAVHGGPKLAPPPPPARVPATPPEPGDYVGVETFWSGKLRLEGDGSLQRDDGRKGVWLFDGKHLILKWESGFPDELRETAPNAYVTRDGRLKVQRAVR